MDRLGRRTASTQRDSSAMTAFSSQPPSPGRPMQPFTLPAPQYYGSSAGSYALGTCAPTHRSEGGRGGSPRLGRGQPECPGSPRLAHHKREGSGAAFPFWSTARMPNCTLSLEMLSVTEVTLPTGIADVQSESVVSRITTSYPVKSDSGLASHWSEVRLVPAKLTGGFVWICAPLGVLGEEASAHSAAAFTPVTRAT